MIDTHCHLTFDDFQEPAFPGGIPRVMADAARHGVTACITISTTTTDCLHALAIAQSHPRVWCSAGIHPLYSDHAPHAWDNLSRAIAHPRCVAWGELGLDNHHPDPPRALQHTILEQHLAFIAQHAAKGIRKPIILHCREAFDDLIPILRASGLPTPDMVFHCFTGTPDDARKILDLGSMLSFTGVPTYKKTDALRDALRLVPLDRLMVETDAPFLSPEPHRSTRPCQPWMVSVTAQRLAEIRGEPWPDFHHALNTNTQRFFRLPPEAFEPLPT